MNEGDRPLAGLALRPPRAPHGESGPSPASPSMSEGDHPPFKLAILGPTASGKSALAAALAQRLGATVVNGDPFQAYRGLAIGTGQPSPEERGEVPHLGYGELPLTQRLNPQAFGGLVRGWLSDCPRAVLVTGSGLYLRGIWQQLSELPEVTEAIQDRTRSWCDRLGAPRLHRFLQAVDPQRAAQLHPNDRSRIQRALALHLATGRRPSELLDGVKPGLPEGWKGLLVLPDREALRARIQRRVRAMVEAGWPEEVQALVRSGQEDLLRELRPLGYLHWLEGGDPRDIEARIVQETQTYAKRQTTFFRNQWPELPVWDPEGEGFGEALARLSI
ncbi:MAG: tRNA ((37)-N6)-dimethylallyltransferase MiaA [Holophagaceae bacterium]|nr:tRNA ((37)-N6)-dimethylallyltransferase MiaA [Holophagaceae bacterium]